jgi:NarL family two-component system response regulator LiaR
MAGMFGVLVIDDHQVFAEAVATALQSQAAISRATTARNHNDAHHAAATQRPDVIVIDAQLGDANGITLLSELLEAEPARRGVVLVETEDADLAAAAVRAGALAVVEKAAPLTTLVTAVVHAARGEAQLSPALLAAVFRRLREGDKQTEAISSRFDALTPRERDVLRLMIEGLDRPAIAKNLYTSVNTIRTHAQNVFRKLGVHSSIEAVSFARRAGWKLIPAAAGTVAGLVALTWS